MDASLGVGTIHPYQVEEFTFCLSLVGCSVFVFFFFNQERVLEFFKAFAISIGYIYREVGLLDHMIVLGSLVFLFFFRNVHTVFQTDYTSFHSHQ